MAISASPEARVGTAPGLTPRAENSSERHSIECQSRPNRRRLRALDHPIRRKAAVTGSRRGSIWRLARPRWPDRHRLLQQLVFGPAGSPSELRALEGRSPRRLPRGWSSRVSVSTGTIPGHTSRNPVPHDREASASGGSFGIPLVLRSPGSDRPPNLRIRWTPPGVRSDRAQPASDHRQRSSPPATPAESVIRSRISRFRQESDRRLSVELARRGYRHLQSCLRWVPNPPECRTPTIREDPGGS